MVVYGKRSPLFVSRQCSFSHCILDAKRDVMDTISRKFQYLENSGTNNYPRGVSAQIKNTPGETLEDARKLKKSQKKNMKRPRIIQKIQDEARIPRRI